MTKARRLHRDTNIFAPFKMLKFETHRRYKSSRIYRSMLSQLPTAGELVNNQL